MPGTLVLKTRLIYLAYLAGYARNSYNPALDDQGLAESAAYALGDGDRRTMEEAKPSQPRGLREVLPIVRRLIEAEPAEDQPVAEPLPEPVIRFTFEGLRYRAPMTFEQLHVARLPDGRRVIAEAFVEGIPPKPIGLRRLDPTVRDRGLACDAVLDEPEEGPTVLRFTFEDVEYVAPRAFITAKLARLPDDRYVEAFGFTESVVNPVPIGLRVAARLTLEDMALAVVARRAEPERTS